MPNSPRTSRANLLDHWHMLLRRRWVLAASIALVLTGVLIKTFRTTPTYRGVATVQIERVDSNILRFQDVVTYDPSALSYQDYYQTQYRLLESRAVALQAVRRLGLDSEPEFLRVRPQGPFSRLWAGLTRSLSGVHRAPADADPDRPLVDAVLADLRIEPVRNSHLVSVAFHHPSARLSARVANGVAEAYINFGMEVRAGTSENAGGFLAEQIETLRKDVAALERQAQEYGEEKEIIPTSGQGNTTLSALEDLQKAFTVSQAARAEMEAAHTALGTAPDSAIPQVLSSPLIKELTAEVAALEREQTELEQKFKPGWPELARVSSKLAQARSRLGEETRTLAASARLEAATTYRSAVERERNLRALLEDQKRAALQLSTDSIEYTNLRSEIAKKRETLDQLLKRQSEISLTAHLTDTRQSSTRIVDRARVPERPFRPNKRLNILLGLLSGLGLGIGLAYAIEYLDNSIKTPEEVRRVSGFPVIGVIPEHRIVGPRPLRRDGGPPPHSAQPDLITHLDPRSPLAEAYKDLRTATLLASPDQPPRTILVTSSLPQEGKSQTCLNLAIALAQTGKSVLVVDTDLRRPRLHRSLDVPNDSGISSYLSGNAPIASLIRETGIPNLHALPSGPVPPNPSELLGSRNFLNLAREFAGSGRYDHLIFDSPPLLSVADPVIMAAVLDGTILVALCGTTPRDALERGAEKLRQANVKVLGSVLNSLGPDAQQGAYYYRDSRPQEAENLDRRADSSL